MQNEGSLSSFPSQNVSPEKKKSDAYGLQYGKAIYTQYISNLWGVFDNKRRLRINRKYAEGLQSVQKYKSLMDMDGDTSYANIDWTPPTIIPKFVDILVDKFLQQDYDFICNPLDPISKSHSDDVIKSVKTAMLVKPILDELEKNGIENPLKGAKVPANNDELNLWLQMTGKIADAIAMEEAMKVVASANNWKAIKTQIIRDLVVCKKAGVKPYYDENNAIRLRAIDPVKMGTSWTDKPDFSNIQYGFELIQVSISQLADMSNGQLSEENLFNIAKLNSTKSGNPGWQWGNTYYANAIFDNRPYNNFLIEVLDFTFSSIDSKKWSEKKNNNGGYYIKERSYEYEVPKNNNGKTTLHEKTIQNCYSGMYVTGTDYIFNYGLQKNMLREKKNNKLSTNVYLPIVLFAPDIYDMENKSLVERMIPFADQIAILHFKIQQLIGKAVPPGIAIDQRALESLAVGMGKGNMSPKDIVEMYMQLGSIVYRSKDSEGAEINNSSIITPLQNGVSPEVMRLVDLINYNINMIRTVTGLNEAADSSTPDKDALIGLQKMALAASNASVRHIKEAYENISERTGKMMAIMIQDLIADGKGKEMFEVALGKDAVAYIESSANFSMMDAGIEIKYKPTTEERQELSQYIQLELETKEIRLEDAIMVKEFDDIKMAYQYLIYRKKKYQEERMQESQMLQAQNAKVQQESAIIAEKAKAESELQILQAKEAYLKVEKGLEMEINAQNHQYKMDEIRLQGELKVEHSVVNNHTKELFKPSDKSQPVQESV